MVYCDIEIVGLNDIEFFEICVYLFEYDLIFGFYLGEVEVGD